MFASFPAARRIAALLFLALPALPVAAAEPAAAPAPLIPLNTVLTHWDHHWFVWMPAHPTYESIEVMSNDAGAGETPLVWVFLTERAGQKRQVHYISDKAAAWAGTLVRPIAYRKQGGLAGQSVHVELLDKDNLPVELSVDVDPGAAMRPAGLTDQSGHAAGSLFLMFFREQGVDAVRNRVRIGGVDYSFNSRTGTESTYPFMAAYSRNVYTAIIPFGQAHIANENGILSHNWGMTFVPRTVGTASLYQTAPAPDGSHVSLEAAPDGGLRAYRHVVGKHELRIAFAPSLRAPASGQAAAVRYGISLDGFQDIVTGTLRASERAGTLSLVWQHDRPQWTKARALTSTLVTDADGAGYTLTVSPAAPQPEPAAAQPAR